MLKEEISKRKEKLRKKIEDAIDEFEEETGFYVKEIGLTHYKTNKGIIKNNNVHIKID